MKIGSKNWQRRWVMGAGGFLGEVTLKSLAPEFVVFQRVGTRCVELTDLFVHPQRRGRGWCKMLLSSTTDYADRRGLDLVLRVCAHGKQRGLGASKLSELYESFGFVGSLAYRKYMIRRSK